MFFATTISDTFYFYPRSPCGERRRGAVICYLDNIISIHALLAESDYLDTHRYDVAHRISIHALLAESDVSLMLYDTSSLIFLSTLSLRRATDQKTRNWYTGEISIHALLAESDRRGSTRTAKLCDFYPRSPCGERPRP